MVPMADNLACWCGTTLSELMYRLYESSGQALPAEEAIPGGDNATAG